MAIAAVTSLPLAVNVDSASPHESQLLDETLVGGFLDELPARLIGDRAYDSDPLDQRLQREWDIELIAPSASIGGRRRIEESCGAINGAGGWNGCSSGFCELAGRHIRLERDTPISGDDTGRVVER